MGPKDADNGSPIRPSKRAQVDDDYDTDFRDDSDVESVAAEEPEDIVDPTELQAPDQAKTTSKLIRPTGKEFSLQRTPIKTPTKPRKSPRKTKTAASTPTKKVASTPKKQKRATPVTPAPASRRVKYAASAASHGMSAREAQINMQRFGAAIPSGFVDLTGDSDEDITITGANSLPPPTQQEEESI